MLLVLLLLGSLPFWLCREEKHFSSGDCMEKGVVAEGQFGYLACH
jgi:hypothetical protein